MKKVAVRIAGLVDPEAPLALDDDAPDRADRAEPGLDLELGFVVRCFPLPVPPFFLPLLTRVNPSSPSWSRPRKVPNNNKR